MTKDTPLIEIHRNLNARIVEFAGYNMPLEYSGVINEHNAVRNKAGLFDVSHMGEFFITGDGALPLLEYTTTNNVRLLKNGEAQYSCLPNGNGGIVDDLIIYRVEENRFMLVVNAANIEKDWKWLQSQNSFGASMDNASDRYAMIALQGPEAHDILQSVTNTSLGAIKSFSFVSGEIGKAKDVIISATGYTGAGGFELYCQNKDAVYLWNILMESGEASGLTPAGLAARDTLRLEMGYSLYGNDIDDSTSPIEANLSWIVKFNGDRDFIDRTVLEQQKKNGVSRKLVGFEMLERGIPRKDYLLLDDASHEIGRVTSGTMSPVLQQGIGMGYVESARSAAGNEIFVQIRNKTIKARIVKLPFIKN